MTKKLATYALATRRITDRNWQIFILRTHTGTDTPEVVAMADLTPRDTRVQFRVPSAAERLSMPPLDSLGGAEQIETIMLPALPAQNKLLGVLDPSYSWVLTHETGTIRKAAVETEGNTIVLYGEGIIDPATAGTSKGASRPRRRKEKAKVWI